MIRNHIRVWRLPAQSPDLNPIELVWNDLKYYLNHEAKVLTERQLIINIKKFWRERVTVAYCNLKIDHIMIRIMDEVIQYEGGPTRR